ncbi:MAG: hypothetical protein K8R67_09225 [Desulfobacteraceae bacterium]|nr:hypothetical protein [Desulfobacteraceae bacterium]
MKNIIRSIYKVTWILVIVFSMIFVGQASGASSAAKVKKVPSNSTIKKSRSVKLAGKPDLMVQMVTVSPKIPTISKDLITIKVTVKNRGTSATSAVCHLTMFIRSVNNAGTPIPGNHRPLIPGYTNNIPILGPGGKHEIYKTFTIHIKHPTGRKEISGIINTESLQFGEESNNQNNYYKTYFILKPKPAPADLVLHDIGVTSDGRIKIKMSNKGKAIPDEDFIRAWVKAEIIGSSPYKQLHLKDMDPNGFLKKPGVPLGLPGQIFVNFIWPDTGPRAIKLTAGYAYSVKVTLDCFPSIVDSNRSNNSKTVTLSP